MTDANDVLVRVRDLRKSYGAIRALDGISFEVSRGDILGFLGPNGAGKTTAMKLITGFLEPDSGTVVVGGHDVGRDPLAAQRRIGYLPENAPAYGEMTVDGFLRFIADAREVVDVESAIDRVMDVTVLKRVRHQTIETLSKGFKRRVGLAQAMIHNPDVLILDEPTDGLDPNQRVLVQDLLANLSQERCAAQGKVEVSVVDPVTDSDEAVEAAQDGLEGRAINQHGDRFFFGLTVETQTGSKEAIPFLWPEEQESIEYEISKRLTSLLWPGSKQIGILAGLEVFGTDDNPYLAQMLAAQGRQPSESWIAIRLLEESYQVSNLGADVEHISHDDYDLVIVIHPKGLGGKALWAIDEWVVTGGKTLVFLDPYSVADPAPQDAQQPWAALQYEPASSLEPLLSAWGLEMPPRTFAADLDLAVQRPVVRGGARESVVVDLLFDGEGWAGSNRQSPVIQGLGEVRFFMTGVLRETGGTTPAGPEETDSEDAAVPAPREPDGMTRTPLIATTRGGSTLAIAPGFPSGSSLAYTDLNDAATLRDAFVPGTEPVVIAYQLDGRLPSAYPDGVEFPSTEPERPPGLPASIDLPPPEGTEMTQKSAVPDDQRAETTVLVYADVDLISDSLGFRRNILGVIQATNDNYKLFLNSVDHLLGSRDLMSVRTARRLDRPFTLFDQIEADAEKETLERERQIREEIERFQTELRSKQAEITERNAALFQRRVQDEVDSLNERIREGNQELRGIRVARRAAIEREENRVRFAVLGWMPTLVLLLGLVLFVRRKRQERHAKRGT